MLFPRPIIKQSFFTPIFVRVQTVWTVLFSSEENNIAQSVMVKILYSALIALGSTARQISHYIPQQLHEKNVFRLLLRQFG